jgi:prepilin-type N-terminal cleavage/methylation domain-containing protein
MMGGEQMSRRFRWNSQGVTLIELLVVLVICSLLVGGIYRLFISQTRAYSVQDQVVEVQQNSRVAMELMMRDLRMTGFDNDRTPVPEITNALTPGPDSITVIYERDAAATQVGYWVDGASRLMRQETVNGVSRTEALLENVEGLEFMYGVDENDDGAMDDPESDGISNNWRAAGSIGPRKVVAVRVTLTARATQVNPDLQNVAPRTLISTVTFRNRSLMR